MSCSRTQVSDDDDVSASIVIDDDVIGSLKCCAIGESGLLLRAAVELDGVSVRNIRGCVAMFVDFSSFSVDQSQQSQIQRLPFDGHFYGFTGIPVILCGMLGVLL